MMQETFLDPEKTPFLSNYEVPQQPSEPWYPVQPYSYPIESSTPQELHEYPPHPTAVNFYPSQPVAPFSQSTSLPQQPFYAPNPSIYYPQEYPYNLQWVPQQPIQHEVRKPSTEPSIPPRTSCTAKVSVVLFLIGVVGMAVSLIIYGLEPSFQCFFVIPILLSGILSLRLIRAGFYSAGRRVTVYRCCVAECVGALVFLIGNWFVWQYVTIFYLIWIGACLIFGIPRNIRTMQQLRGPTLPFTYATL